MSMWLQNKVAVLEKDVTALRERYDELEKRVELLERLLANATRTKKKGED